MKRILASNGNPPANPTFRLRPDGQVFDDNPSQSKRNKEKHLDTTTTVEWCMNLIRIRRRGYERKRRHKHTTTSGKSKVCMIQPEPFRKDNQGTMRPSG